jgi:hypothetical protein
LQLFALLPLEQQLRYLIQKLLEVKVLRLKQLRQRF